MNKNDDYQVLCGAADLQQTAGLPALLPFDERVIAFLSALSGVLLKDKAAKAYPDIITFAFFCRRASLLQMRQEYEGELDSRVGRGMVFHIAPGNVPINFAYSLAAGLLAGNGNVVKASSQDFEQTRIVCDAMKALFDGEYSHLQRYVNVITYPREMQALTERLSDLCDVRIIWGGDETVRRVREASLPPFAFDVTFADRYSLLCLTPGAVLALAEEQLAAVAQGFYNDTFLSDQNACTAPRLVYWVSDDEEQTARGQERFWQAVHTYAAPRYPVEPVIAVDKLTALYRAAVTLPGARRMPMPDNLIARVQVEAIGEALTGFRCAGGCFVEYVAADISALADFVCRKVQTLSYLGLDPKELRRFVREKGLRGIDRIVPIGKTMDFSLTWDGYDLIRTLSRRVQTL